VLVDREAVRHLFEVASSIDSMVVGEPQVLGQVKDAYRISTECKTSGPLLNRVLHQTFRVSKRVRSETLIGRHAVSVSYAAVELARNIFESFEDKSVLLVGAGEMVELAVKHFVERGAGRTLISNRTLSRAQALAWEFRGEAVPFESLSERLAEADIVLTCTGSQEPVIRAEDVKGALRRRKNRPMFFIDIAVPRDVDARVNDIENAYLYDIDDLQRVVAENRDQREGEIEKARAIIDGEVSRFLTWYQSLEVEPTIKAMRQKAEDMRRAEVQKTLARFPGLGEKERDSVEAMTRTLVNKILHHPVTTLKRESGKDGSGVYVGMVRDLFGLEEEGRDP
jgi:glutamyl-tRNA reductase